MPLDPATPLALSRVAFGAVGWLSPRTGLAMTLLDPGDTQATYLLRLFAVREAALGAATLLAPQRRDEAVVLGLVTDTLDTAAGLLALRRGTVSRGTGVVATAVAASAVALGAASLRLSRRGRG